MPKIKTFAKRSGNFRQLAEEMQRKTLEAMAHKAVDVSPVDTAAYVDSFGFNDPQGFSSRGRTRGQDEGASKGRNKARLSAEVAALNFSGPVVFGNSAPHAGIVETGARFSDGRSPQAGKQVFGQVRREFTAIARRALQETKQR